MLLEACLILVPSCFEADVGYSANSVGIGEFLAHTSLECQQKCMEYDSCKIFIFMPSDKTCHLKDVKESPYTQRGIISGPSSCDGMKLMLAIIA